MAEESDEALEISSNEESGTDRDDTKENMDQSTSKSLQSGSPLSFSCWIAQDLQLLQTYPERDI